MGIPYYFYTLSKKYENILLTSIPKNVKIFAMDFNGIIHPVVHSLELKINADETIIYNELWKKIEYLMNYVKPTNTHIFVDGVAPLAKIIQQRKRRYLSTLQKKMDNKLESWNTNAITPGTSFMNNLNAFLKTKENILYNGSDMNGEGEHKIFEMLSLNQDILMDDNILIHGLDADLIILSLMSECKGNIYLMREGNDDAINCIDISTLKKCILLEMGELFNISEITDTDVIESYCVMCSLLGNDFIPHLLTINLKTNGLNKILQIASKIFQDYGLVVKNSIIDKDVLIQLFKNLSLNENEELYSNVTKYLVSKPIQYDVDKKNYDEFAKSLVDNLQWRKTYYNYIFDVNESNDISTISHKYLDGIYWTFNYYKKNKTGCIDHGWFYPFCGVPTLTDIANNIITHSYTPNLKHSFISNSIQLLIVTPIQSVDILDHKLQKYMKDSQHGLTFMYPTKYKIIRLCHKHLWECSPVLPMIDIKTIKNVLIE
jgi:5'-3' exonuclease